jgi:hypothetical protein
MARRLVGAALVLIFLAVRPAGVTPDASAAVQPADPTLYLLAPEDLPAGFEHQPDKDRFLTQPGGVRVVRFFARGAPDVPTEDHASILLAASVNDSAQQAATDFHDTVSTWTRLGYDLAPLVVDGIGDEAVAGWEMLYEGTDHPKRAVLILFRLGRVSAEVQWTDDPAEVTLEHAAAIARLMELRIVAQG